MASVSQRAPPIMRRRLRNVLLVLLTAAVAALALRPWVWSPVEGVRPARRPSALAITRSAAEHDALHEAMDGPYLVELTHRESGAVLRYHGTRHVVDPLEPRAIATLDALRRGFASRRPSLVLIEGRLGWHFGGEAAAVQRFGEAGLTASLARAAGLPLRSLEPELADELAAAVTEFGARPVLAFYFLRVYVSDRDRGELGGDRNASAAALLRKRAARLGLASSFADLVEFDRFWSESSAGMGDWRTLPAEALWRRADGTWLQCIAERINLFRDEHMVAVLLEALARGEDVFAVCGASHVILQEPALRAALR
jgi:hypothetical protein